MESDALQTLIAVDDEVLVWMCLAEERTRFKTEHGVLGWDKQDGRFYGDERKCLLCSGRACEIYDRIIGHNIFDFDLKFILKRSVINSALRSTFLLHGSGINRFSTLCTSGSGGATVFSKTLVALFYRPSVFSFVEIDVTCP
jgi:hypothetical protein